MVGVSRFLANDKVDEMDEHDYMVHIIWMKVGLLKMVKVDKIG